VLSQHRNRVIIPFHYQLIDLKFKTDSIHRLLPMSICFHRHKFNDISSLVLMPLGQRKIRIDWKLDRLD